MTRPRTIIIAAAGLLVVATTACGTTDDDTAGDGARTIEINMADNTFEPDTLDVTEGETVRFVFTNTGAVAHDAFIGDTDAQADHEMDMSEADGGMAGGDHGDADRDAVIVEPGDTAELSHTFEGTDTLEIGCHQPGHYAGGMTITIGVT